MYWVVQNNIRDEGGYERFLQALRDLNVEHTVVKVIPFAHECVPDVEPTGRVIAWGSTSMDMIAKKKGWTPGTYLNENFDQRIWSEAFGVENMLNGDAEYLKFGSIPEFEGRRFIRPVHDMKVFAGEVVNGRCLYGWQKDVRAISDSYSTLTCDTPVSVSSVKVIDAEERCFVVGGRVVTATEYRAEGRLLTPAWAYNERFMDLPVFKFAQAMVDRWQPAEAFVMDVAIVGDSEYKREYKVIEVNCINSSGFYAADMKAVVEAIERLL